MTAARRADLLEEQLGLGRVGADGALPLEVEGALPRGLVGGVVEVAEPRVRDRLPGGRTDGMGGGKWGRGVPCKGAWVGLG